MDRPRPQRKFRLVETQRKTNATGNSKQDVLYSLKYNSTYEVNADFTQYLFSNVPLELICEGPKKYAHVDRRLSYQSLKLAHILHRATKIKEF